MIIERGLVIDTPWISIILSGDKIWEMRSTNTKQRAKIGLIRKGSGLLVGVASVKGVSGPYSNEELGETYESHRVGSEFYSKPEYKWRYAWELEKVVELKNPVPYAHNNGAVTWVKLSPSVQDKIVAQLY